VGSGVVINKFPKKTKNTVLESISQKKIVIKSKKAGNAGPE